jgi:anti-sigma factor RsiW
MSDTTCEIIRDRIDDFVDDELGSVDRNAVQHHCTHCAACAGELALALRVRKGLRALPAFDAPARVIDAAARELDAPRIFALPAPRSRRWVVPVAAALAVAAGAVWLLAERTAPVGPTYSAAEVRQARDEMELAFRYVDHYSARTARIIQVDVMEKRVAPRVERAFVTSRDAAVRDALVPGLKRAVRESGLGVTSAAPARS